MTDRHLLVQLCHALGVLTEYRDVFGSRRQVPVEVLRSLLASLRLPLDDPDATREWLARREEDQWRCLLPPVHVHRQSAGPCDIALSLPESQARETFRWQLTAEDGTVHAGRLRPAELPVTEKKAVGGESRLRCTFTLPVDPGLGYHKLEVSPPRKRSAFPMLLVVAPDACHVPDALRDERRVWGLAVQLYGVRTARNWGMGDFTDLARLVETAAGAGASLVGLNPLHALFPHNPRHASPYCPSSRCLLNVLYLDVEAVPEFADCQDARQTVYGPDFQARLRALRGEPLVDYAGVAAAKREVLERLYRHFREAYLDRDSERGRDFRCFQAGGGEILRRQGLYEALQEQLHAEDAARWGWPAWPEPYQRPDSKEVREFAATHGERIEFFHYLQWLADAQLGAAGRRSLELRLGIGLYLDIAVGADLGGCEVWSHQDLYAIGAHVGAPPDDFNRKGQDWGLPPLDPVRLRDAAYAPFIAMLRENMRHAGAIRLDHVMGLMRLYWVPEGRSPAEGGYVLYPFDDLLGILALESVRNQCLVVGEDLGTVPDAVRAALAPLKVYSYRLLLLEREADGTFPPPGRYPAQSLAAVSTHDLPTLRGFWKGLDLDVRGELGLFPDEATREALIVARARDRAQLLVALEREGLLPPGTGVHPVAVPEMTDELARNVHRMLSRAPSQILMVQMEDVLGVLEQANLPGTVDQHPNWRRKLPLELDAWPEDWRAAALFGELARERGPAPSAPSASPLRIPRATYRLQFNRHFTFAAAEALVPYLAELGVSHCYASPILKARPGSTHGYDIVDHNAFNPEIGTADEFRRFSDALGRHGMGLMLDIVPNHMGVLRSDNGWWLDVLENGRASAYAGHFDIDWEPANPDMHGKVLLPVLGDHYGRVLENGELTLNFAPERGEFHIQYYDHRFPVDPREYPRILGRRGEVLTARLGAGNPVAQEFGTLAASFGRLPSRDHAGAEAAAERSRDAAVHKRQLAQLCVRSADVAAFVAEDVAEINGRPGNPDSFDGLHDLLRAQAYRLSYWRVAADDINYRRFFDINDLAGLRMEQGEVFEAAHRLVFRLLAEGRVDALRIDHPDGLYDPLTYFRRLQAWRDWRAARRDDGDVALYLVIEKILAGHEQLPESWPVHGTTGYCFANLVNGLFVDPAAESKFERLYASFTGERSNFDTLVYHAKLLVMKTAMASELNVLANRLTRIAQADRHTRDYTLNALRRALAEMVACFPVYRTYIADGLTAEQDRRAVDWALSLARRRSRADDISVFDFLHKVLAPSCGKEAPSSCRPAFQDFVGKFQQYTGPVMAKGFEDTALYRYHRLVSLNDVGSDPRTFGVSVATFHEANRQRAEHWPHNLLATATHDSKRSEDVRARIDVLSEMPALWRLGLRRWTRFNRSRKTLVEDQPAPDRNDEYLLYQTLAGSWPLEAIEGEALAAYTGRVVQYMLKAVREAKVHSSWINPDAAYEAALESFIRTVLAPRRRNLFLRDFAAFQKTVSHFGLLNSLAQALLKLTAPGVPDIYQGNEAWRFSLVDPDNRGPVDFGRLAGMLASLKGEFGCPGLARSLLDNLEDGRAKQYLTWRTLQTRRDRPDLFGAGAYLPLDVQGEKAEHLCAYGRSEGDTVALVVVPRLCFRLLEGQEGLPLGEAVWGDTTLALPPPWQGRLFRDAFTGRELAVEGPLAVGGMLAEFPVALLVPSGDGG